MRILAKVSYRGSNYQGWQKQVDAPSVEESIESVLERIFSNKITIYGAGRTDAKVHAKGQTFHFDIDKVVDLGKLKHSLNSLLPNDVHILSLVEVDREFHARYSATKKIYEYKINQNEFDPFSDEVVYQYGRKLDVHQMEKAAKMFIGKHSFANFTSKEEDESNFVRTIYDIKFKDEEGIITITFFGDGFMRFMVRDLVGALIKIGEGKLLIEELESEFNHFPRKIVSYKAPANGLTLLEVIYE